MSFSTMPCVSKFLNGSSHLHKTEVVHHARPKTRVEQMQNRVLDAADVLINRHPVVAVISHRGVLVGTGEAQKYHEESTKVSIVSVSRRAARATLRALAVHELHRASQAGYR